MRLRSLLLLAGVIALGFGLAFLFAPRPMLALYGVGADPRIVLVSRFFGAALVQLGMVLYLIRDVSDVRTQRGVVIGSFLGSLAGLVVALTGQFWGRPAET
jgi:asparagine N-glycosylation enzyme membrane subunit Stt3